MDAEAVRRYGRQLALASFGPDAQAALMEARVVVAGAGLAAETAARYLAGAGVGCLRLDARLAERPGFLAALRGSQPGLHVELIPASRESQEAGAVEIASLEGAALLLKEGFDDDAWLGAAVRLGVPAIFARSSAPQGGDGDPLVEVLSFRRHGPCPHVPLARAGDRPPAPDRTSREGAQADAVAAGALAAAEGLRLLGAHGRGETEVSTARHLRLPLGRGTPRVQDIPWSPACFACGGHGAEMSFI